MIRSINIEDFDEYIRQGEPDKKEKAYIWQTAIGFGGWETDTRTYGLRKNGRDNLDYMPSTWQRSTFRRMMECGTGTNPTSIFVLNKAASQQNK